MESSVRILLLVLLCCLAVRAEPLIQDRIAALEASRQPYGTELQAYLKHPDPEVRARAVRAVGRLQDPAAVEDLAVLLEDEYPEVRLEAAFALGQIPGRASEKVLLGALRREIGLPLRLRLIEAAVKAGDSSMLTRLDDWLESDEPAVLRTAAIGCGQYVMRRQRWEPELPALPDKMVARLRTLLDHPDPEVQEGALYALWRLEDRGSSARAAALLSSPEPDVAEAAARLLASAAQSDARVAMLQARASKDWLVRYELTRGLARVGEVSGLKPLLSDPHPSVRRGACQAVGKLGVAALSLAPELSRLVDDEEADVAEAAVEALGLVGRDSVLEELRRAAHSPRWRVRRGACRALVARLPGTRADVLALASDPATGVVEAALEGFKQDRTPEAEARVGELLAGQDVARIAAAADVLATWKEPSWAPVLMEAYGRTQEIELQQSLLEALGPLGNPAAIPLLEEVAQSQDTNLARAARKSLVAFHPVDPLPADQLPGSGPTAVKASLPDRVEEDTAVLTTERGVVRLHLLGQEAPGTVRNFVQLARQGYYDGLTFHRVVPDFVTQGGDPRGDGWGGPGYTIRCEINPVPYQRGTVGMALAGKDTGGSQFFICQSAQPHLDGRYTVWAQVEDGMDVVDRLQEGDKILKVEVR